MPNGVARSIEVRGHLIGCSTAPGEEVGSLVITDVKGKQRKYPFIDGKNIADWKINLGRNGLSQVHFKKRIKLAGRSAYPDAYRDFNAKVHISLFDLKGLDELRKLDFKFNLRNGKMVIWGIRLLD